MSKNRLVLTGCFLNDSLEIILKNDFNHGLDMTRHEKERDRERWFNIQVNNGKRIHFYQRVFIFNKIFFLVNINNSFGIITPSDRTLYRENLKWKQMIIT